MKTTTALLSCLTLAQGFTTPSKHSRADVVLKAEPFGAAPMMGGNTLFLGKTEWEKFTTEIGSEQTGAFLRAAEIKHGRSAMIATVGFAFQKMGITFDKFSPHEYLSVTQNIKFSDLTALGPVEAIKAIPVEGLAQIFAVIAAIEIYELTHRDGEIKNGESVAPGLQAGGLTGYNLNWNPLDFEISDRRKLVEIQNGRAAMFAISAWVAAETIQGSVPIPLPW
eukprot:CAMPEP_0198145084 /NCGR_PEP_ID=MMETSP1443-20131203/21037_1 /TAXON_ID=186043 /ORGANISM="Entomoneis sp., Strain CCMP2396" /LENGTH=222 /DNA_ID=CAMNT_0043808613 /DNA_START=33 /DNA_END=701 /DNA_ORIENTATION=-